MTIEVSSWTDLDNVRNDTGEDYVLTADLDSNTVDYVGIGDDFEPIIGGGELVFDGDGHTIGDLIVDVESTAAGLFNSAAAISDLGVVGADVFNAALSPFNQQTGVLIGRASGTLIERCWAAGSVVAESDPVGGLVGAATNGATIRECFATVSVSGPDDLGGFAGECRNGTTVAGCYALSTVEGSPDSGGFARTNNDSTIEASWAASEVIGDGSGFVDSSRFGATEPGCYWDADVGPSSTDGDATGLSTSEMQGLGVESAMPGLRYVADFSRVVGGDNADVDGYPILRAVPVGPQDAQQAAAIAGYRTVVAGLAATALDNPDSGPEIELSWTDRAAGEDLFRVYRTDGVGGVFPDAYAMVVETLPDAEAALDGDVELESTYSYRVVAVEDAVESDPTDADTAIVGSSGPFVIEIVATNSPVGVGETLELDVEVTNLGEFSGETTVTADLTEQ